MSRRIDLTATLLWTYVARFARGMAGLMAVFPAMLLLLANVGLAHASPSDDDQLVLEAVGAECFVAPTRASESAFLVDAETGEELEEEEERRPVALKPIRRTYDVRGNTLGPSADPEHSRERRHGLGRDVSRAPSARAPPAR